MSCAVRYDVIYQPFSINSQYLRTWEVMTALRYPFRGFNTTEGSKRLKERENYSKTKGNIHFWVQNIAIYIRQTKTLAGKSYMLSLTVPGQFVDILKTALYTLIISLGPGFSDRFSMGSESAIVFSIVLIQKNEIKMTKRNYQIKSEENRIIYLTKINEAQLVS